MVDITTNEANKVDGDVVLDKAVDEPFVPDAMEVEKNAARWDSVLEVGG
ncbi:hypothetical protein NPIL_132541, partial [Nephila pilipes]